MGESEEELKILLMKVKKESDKAGLKLNIQKTKIMASSHTNSCQIDWKTMETVTDFIFLGSKTTADIDCSHEIKRCLLLGRKADQPRQHIKKQRHYFANKSQSYVFSSGHVWMWELDYKESWGAKNWYFRTVVLEKTLESSLDCKEIHPVHPKGDQSWIFIGRTDAKVEAPILWPPDAKSWLIRKHPDVGKDWSQEEKGTTEDEMVGWHHWLNAHEFEQAPGDSEGQGSLARCSPWDREKLDTTETEQQRCFTYWDFMPFWILFTPPEIPSIFQFPPPHPMIVLPEEIAAVLYFSWCAAWHLWVSKACLIVLDLRS